MKTNKVLVAGATGNVGPMLVGRLRNDGYAVRVLARDTRNARRILRPDVEIVRGDLNDPASLAPAFRDVAAAYVATSPTPALAGQETAFIEAARVARVERLVKLSGFGIEFSSDRIHMAHASSERRLKDSGLAWVVLRPVVFMSNLLFDAASIRSGKLPSIFGTSRISLVDPGDVAEVAARALVSTAYEGRTLEFGGPEPLSWDMVAGALTRVLGRPVEHVRLDRAAFEAGAALAGLPEFVIEAIMATATSAQQGKYEVSDDIVLGALGRRATSLDHWIVRHRDAFAPNAQQ